MTRQQLTFGMLLLIALPIAASGQDQESLRRSFLDTAPPELVGDAAHWLGKAPPVMLAQLKGKVVWLQFNF